MAAKPRIPYNAITANRIAKSNRTVFGTVQGGIAVPLPPDGAPIAPIAAPTAPAKVFTNAPFQQYNVNGSLYLPFDANRVYLMVQNLGSGTMYIDFSGATGLTTGGLRLPGSVFAFYEPAVAPQSAVNISGQGIVFTGAL